MFFKKIEEVSFKKIFSVKKKRKKDYIPKMECLIQNVRGNNFHSRVLECLSNRRIFRFDMN